MISSFAFDGPMMYGEDTTLMCDVSKGDDPLTISWSFHGENVSGSSMGLSTFKIGRRTSLLKIESIIPGHSGEYTCTARNEAGIANHTASLIVHGIHLPKFSSFLDASLK